MCVFACTCASVRVCVCVCVLGEDPAFWVRIISSWKKLCTLPKDLSKASLKRYALEGPRKVFWFIVSFRALMHPLKACSIPVSSSVQLNQKCSEFLLSTSTVLGPEAGVRNEWGKVWFARALSSLPQMRLWKKNSCGYIHVYGRITLLCTWN